MDGNASSDNGEEITTRFKINKRTWAIIALPFILAFALIFGYITRFGSCLSDSPVPNASEEGLALSCLYSFGADQWGQAGDFFGGVLNPFIGLVTIILIVHTIKQNQKALHQNERALADSQQELKISNKTITEQKELMAFDLKHRLFTDIICQITSLSPNRRNIAKGKTIQTIVEFASHYIEYVVDPDLHNDNQFIGASSFQDFAFENCHLFTGLVQIYWSFPEQSEFRNTLELSAAVRLDTVLVTAFGIYILEEMSFLDSEKNDKVFMFIKGVLQKADSPYCREVFENHQNKIYNVLNKHKSLISS